MRQMINNLSDDACIKQFQNTGEEEVFNCLLNRHRVTMRRIIYSVLKGSKEDMEDVEQEIALALFKNLPSFSFKSSFTTYLYRISRNKAVDFLRKTDRHRKIINKAALLSSRKPQELPDETLVKKSIHEEIKKVLFQLPEMERTILVLKDVEQLSLSDIGTILHKPVGTVKSRLHRARLHAAERIKAREII